MAAYSRLTALRGSTFVFASVLSCLGVATLSATAQAQDVSEDLLQETPQEIGPEIAPRTVKDSSRPGTHATRGPNRDLLDAMVAVHARINGVPASLVHRVIVRESRYNPHLIGKGSAMGLMQIKPATARSLGYNGSAQGLLDAETNLTYAVRYLAGAYRLAGGNESRAVSYYARGYYYDAKRKGLHMQALAREPDQE